MAGYVAAFGLECEKYSSKGKLVPDEIISKIVIQQIKEHAGENWLLDGTLVYPVQFIDALPNSFHIPCLR